MHVSSFGESVTFHIQFFFFRFLKQVWSVAYPGRSKYYCRILKLFYEQVRAVYLKMCIFSVQSYLRI